jgi:hypothetical protein
MLIFIFLLNLNNLMIFNIVTFDTMNDVPDDWSFEVTFTNIKLQEDY